METPATILTAILDAGVKHAAQYNDYRFRTMPFHTLFGLNELLAEYNIQSQGLRLSDKSEINKLPLPFIALIEGNYVIVAKVDAKHICYSTLGEKEQICSNEFIKAWSGVAFLVHPGPQAQEPDYTQHRLAEIMTGMRDSGLSVVSCFCISVLRVRFTPDGQQ